MSSVIIWDKIGEDKKQSKKQYNVYSSRDFSLIDIDFDNKTITIGKIMAHVGHNVL